MGWDRWPSRPCQRNPKAPARKAGQRGVVVRQPAVPPRPAAPQRYRERGPSRRLSKEGWIHRWVLQRIGRRPCPPSRFRSVAVWRLLRGRSDHPAVSPRGSADRAGDTAFWLPAPRRFRSYCCLAAAYGLGPHWAGLARRQSRWVAGWKAGLRGAPAPHPVPALHCPIVLGPSSARVSGRVPSQLRRQGAPRDPPAAGARSLSRGTRAEGTQGRRQRGWVRGSVAPPRRRLGPDRHLSAPPAGLYLHWPPAPEGLTSDFLT